MKKRTRLILVSLVGLFAVMVLLLRFEGGGRYPRESICRTHLKVLRNHLEQYKMQVGRYPSNEEGLGVFVRPPANADDRRKWHVQLYEVVPLDPWDRPYVYLAPGRLNPAGFDLFSLGPDGVQSEDDIYSVP